MKNLKKVSFRDITGIFKFVIILLPALIYKLYLKINQKKVWLICETENTARDNGYIFYEYMLKKHPEVSCFYAINKKTKDYNKLSDKSKIINWASIKHYFYYIVASKNISSHKEGNPNHSLFTILHLKLNLFNNRVFLQHGVLYQDFSMFHKKNTKFKIFISGAIDEYNFLKERYGYGNEIKYTGLARFDNLFNYKIDENIILFIPTWRRWINNKEEFLTSEYFKRINELINDKKILELLEKNNKYLYFYIHQAFAKYIDCFNASNHVKIFNHETAELQEILKNGALLITDYSSIFTDFAFMKKPIIYYQFDKDIFMKKHYNNLKESYFDFDNNGFGKVVNDKSELIKEIQYYVQNNFKIKSIYEKRIKKFFKLHDNKNCERIYNVIIGVDKL